MQLLVLTDEKTWNNDIRREVDVIHQLFEEGLPVLHLRKNEHYQDYLELINSSFHKRITLHGSHTLCEEYEIGGIHFKERDRKNKENQLKEQMKYFKSKNIRLSTSAHALEDAVQLGSTFDYVFLSPLFNSISKENYQGKGTDINKVNSAIIGLGGVNPENINKAKRLGYHDVAALGYIWNNDDPVNAYLKLKNCCSEQS